MVIEKPRIKYCKQRAQYSCAIAGRTVFGDSIKEAYENLMNYFNELGWFCRG